jgi:hypothetical protein
MVPKEDHDADDEDVVKEDHEPEQPPNSQGRRFLGSPEVG